jgi:hypothetical protein
MVTFVARRWLLAASVTAALAAAPAFAAKDVVVAVGSISPRWIRMTPTTRSPRRWRNRSIRACLAWIKR